MIAIPNLSLLSTLGLLAPTSSSLAAWPPANRAAALKTTMPGQRQLDVTCPDPGPDIDTTQTTGQVFFDFDNLPAESPRILSGTPDSQFVLTDNFACAGIVFGRVGESTGVVVSAAIPDANSSPNGLSGLSANGKVPAYTNGDIHFSFVVPGTMTDAETDYVSFYAGDSGGDEDTIHVQVFDLGGTMIFEQTTTKSAYEHVVIQMVGIHRVKIERTNANKAGYFMDDLSFNIPYCDSDADGDGVPDCIDICSSTAAGDAINTDGCSVADMCPCQHNWKNHGAFMKCIAHAAEAFVKAGIISEDEKDTIVSNNAKLNCGKRNKGRFLRS